MLNFDALEIDFDDGFSSSIFSKCLANDSKKSEQNRTEEEHIKENSFNELFDESLEMEEFPRKQDNSVKSCDFFENLQKDKSINSFLCQNSSSNEHSNGNTKPSETNVMGSMKRPSLQNEAPQKKRVSHSRLMERKFPGPAGLLPDKPFANNSEDLSHLMDKSLNEENKEPGKTEPIIYSQSSASVFLEPTYQKTIVDFDLNEPANPLSKYTVEWVKKTAAKKALHGRKIPFLAVVLHSINHRTPDPVLMLRDPTGEIQGTLHREVWANLGGKLRVGITLALRQVGVLITGVIRRQIYINITLNNILAIYSPSETDDTVEVRTVNKISKEDLMRSFEEWQAQAQAQAVKIPPKPSSSPSLFSTIDSNSSFGSREPQNFRNQVPIIPKEIQHNGNKRGKDEDGNPRKFLADLGIVLTDGDFNDVMDLPKNKPEVFKQETGFKPKYRVDIQDRQPVFVDMGASKKSRMETEVNMKSVGPGQVLSQADNLILEEVLSGVDLNEFDF